MVRVAKITRMISSILAEIKGIGGTTQNRMVSLKGLYSKPKDENAIVIPLSQGNNQDVIFVLQKEINLNDGDIYLTDDKSYIHFHFNGNSIELKTKDLTFDVDTFKVKAKSVELKAEDLAFDVDTFKVKAKSVDFDGCSISNNGTPIDDTHVHLQNAGDHFGGGVYSNPPK